MAKAPSSINWQRALIVLAGTVVGVVVVACLYLAQVVFIPVAVAVFLTFLLSPLVAFLQRRGLRRTPSVILVVFLAALLLGGIGFGAVHQVMGLVEELPRYTDNITNKIKSLRGMAQGAGAGRFEKMLEDITTALKSKPQETDAAPAPKPPASPLASSEQPSKTVSQPDSLPWLSRLPSFLGPAVEIIGGFALALVLAIFMLLKREDLRNRLIRLVGQGRMTVTTKALDDAGARISRFLLVQVIVNASYGLALGVGLFVIGVDYAFLWGLLAAVLRYIPYIGAWVAGLLPITLSLAMFPGWVQPLFVIGLFLAIELTTNYVLEPRLYGQTLGVSEAALLVAAAVWAFLWGPIGLILSSPLTVCLVVLGKYVPQLKFFDVLMGDEPALDPDITYYQRLLARDQDEATQLVLTRVRTLPPEQAYDDLLVPALTYTKRDRQGDELTDSDEQFILQATRDIVDDLGERRAATASGQGVEPSRNGGAGAGRPKVLLLGCQARDEADWLVLEMLRQLLDPTRWEVEVLSKEMLSAELVALAGEKDPAFICIGALPPGGLARTRYLCKRLRARLPAARIVVGRWGLKTDVEQEQESLREAGADHVETTLLATRTQLAAWLPVLAQGQPSDLPAAAATNREAVTV